MTTMSQLPPQDAPLEKAPDAFDEKLEVFLDEMVASSRDPGLPPDFTVRVLEARAFAPWEVRRPSAWKLPAAVAGLLLAGSAGLVLTPFLKLGPGTAFLVWGELLAVAFGRPVATLLAAAPLLPEAASRVSGALPGFAPWALGGLALLTAGTLALTLGQLGGRRVLGAADARRG